MHTRRALGLRSCLTAGSTGSFSRPRRQLPKKTCRTTCPCSRRSTRTTSIFGAGLIIGREAASWAAVTDTPPARTPRPGRALLLPARWRRQYVVRRPGQVRPVRWPDRGCLPRHRRLRRSRTAARYRRREAAAAARTAACASSTVLTRVTSTKSPRTAPTSTSSLPPPRTRRQHDEPSGWGRSD